MDLSLVTSEVDSWQVVAVAGEIDIATAPVLRERLVSLINDGSSNLVVDLAEVGFIDSTGLGVLVGALKRARTAGGELRLASSHPRVQKLLEVTRLDAAFDTFDTVEAAVRGAEA